jgi:hypothetical protein
MINSNERGKAMRPVFCGALAAVFALYFALIARAAPQDACEEARAQDKRVVAEVTDSRVLTAVAAAVEVSGFQQHVVTCEISVPYLSATVEKLEDYYYVGVTKMLVEHTTDAELRAALGHEIAHIVLGHRTSSFELTHIRTAKYEQEADALSALWFGKAGMRSLLKKLRVDAMRLPKPSQRRLATAEIDARIKMLQ